eukprot:10295091-Alexandrium_andersonii.AAC.1
MCFVATVLFAVSGPSAVCSQGYTSKRQPEGRRVRCSLCPAVSSALLAFWRCPGGVSIRYVRVRWVSGCSRTGR